MMREQIAALTEELEKRKARIEEEQPVPADQLPTIHPYSAAGYLATHCFCLPKCRLNGRP